MIVSFDLSTTVAGYCIYDIKDGIKKLSYYKFQSKELLDRGFELAQLIYDIKEEFPEITDFVIEERLMAFQSRMSNAQSLFNTAQINYLAQYLWAKKLVKVHQLNVQTARKLAYPTFHKVARTLDIDNKEYAFELVIKELGEELFPKKILKSGKNKGNEVFLEEAKDMADSFILSKAFVNRPTEVEAINTKSKKKSK